MYQIDPELKIHTHDMYGHEIIPIGETGYGISTTFYQHGNGIGKQMPLWTLFHISDGFRQCLFMFNLDLDQPMPHLYNTFPERIAEVQRLAPDVSN